jgi:hypothetical protein
MEVLEDHVQSCIDKTYRSIINPSGFATSKQVILHKILTEYSTCSDGRFNDVLFILFEVSELENQLVEVVTVEIVITSI